MRTPAEILHHWRRAAVAHLDIPLLVITLAIMAVGLMTVFSATYDGNNRAVNQLTNMAIALLVMWGIARIPPQRFMHFAVPLYILCVILLVAVFLFGVKVNGSRRWLSLGFTRIQPSELMKLAMPLMLAWYFHKHEHALRPRTYGIAALLLLVPFALVAKQPDLGTAILIGAAGFYVLFLAGLSWKVILGLGTAAVAAAPFAWTLLHDYQRKRILTLIDPTSDPLGTGYHIIQASIAIGSGGVLGKGYLNGSQTHLEFIPEKHTDFIFAVFSEEWGLLGNTLLLVLYTLLIGRGMFIASTAPTLFSRLLAGAVTLSFFSYVFINMGMVSGVLPVVGVPLPFLSYGGTALVTMFAGIGILMSIQTHRMLVKR